MKTVARGQPLTVPDSAIAGTIFHQPTEKSRRCAALQVQRRHHRMRKIMVEVSSV